MQAKLFLFYILHKPHTFCLSQVLLFVPNLVGYCRLGFLGASLLTGTSRPALTASLFLVNFALDGVDGLLARALQQVCAPYMLNNRDQCMHAVNLPATFQFYMAPLMTCRPRRLVPS